VALTIAVVRIKPPERSEKIIHPAARIESIRTAVNKLPENPGPRAVGCPIEAESLLSC
jgi:hypothetical protein